MSLPKMPGTLAGLAMGAVVAAGGAMPALGAVAYDVELDTTKTSYPQNSFIQQRGNGFTEYGDNVQLGAGAPQLLQNVVLPMVLAVYEDNVPTTPTSYTANLKLNIYAVDAGGLPTTLLGTVNKTESFNTYEYTTSRPGVYAATEYVTFDFIPQGGIILPVDGRFAFAISDTAATATGDNVALQNSLSIWADQIDSTDGFGSTQANGIDTPREFLQNFAGTWTLVPRESQNTDTSVAYNIVAEINTTAVPEPASMALLGAGGLMLLRRKRA